MRKSLKTLRLEKGLSQIELARLAGCSVRSIQLWEGGGSQPGGARAVALAAALGVSAGEILGESIARDPGVPYSAAEPQSVAPYPIGSAAAAVLAVLQGGEMKLSEAALGRLIHRVMKRAEAEGRAADQPMAREELQALLAEMLG